MSLTPAEFDFHACEVALGDAIRLAREHKGMSQADLGKRIGIDEKLIAGVESGDVSLSLNTIADLIVNGLEIRFGEIGHFVDKYLGRT